MKGLRTHAVAGDLSEDASATGTGVLGLLEHEDARTLPDHEPVAAGVEGARRLLRRLVAGAQRTHGVEGADARLADGRFGAAGQHCHSGSAADDLEGVADGIGPGRAGGADRAERALQPKFERHLRRGHVRDHHRGEEWAHAPWSVLEQYARLLLEGRQPAAAAGHHRADVLRLAGRVESGVVQRLSRCRHRVVGVGIHAARRAPIDVVLRV